ncbi:MAG: hypothetical protein JXM70_06220 [Pirellulales bacterium]|nr:hypothetical protein [Pirellulales bacterium]
MRISSKYNRNTIAVLAGMWLSIGVGCTSLNAPSVPEMPSLPSMPAVSKVFEKQEPVAEPNSLAVVWTTAMIDKEGSRPTRGFGGMVTFYDKDKKKPVRVDGQLTIYAYENLSYEQDGSTPDRKYIFKPEQLEKHYGEGPVGPSYSIWIPWDEADGERKEIGLIMRFDSAKGKTVMGKPTHNVLTGTKVAKKSNPEKNNPAAEDSNVEQVCYLPPVDGQTRYERPKASGPRMKTMTLSVPSRITHPITNRNGTVQQPSAQP